MPSVESLLSRELDLRFIDARAITAEARVALGIEGYPSMDKGSEIREEAIRIFQNKAENEKEAMRRMNWELEALKSTSNSISGMRSDTSSESSNGRGEGGGVFGFLRRR